MADTITVGQHAKSPPEDVVEEIDADNDVHRNSVHQRLRANSSIMQVKKILGMFMPTSLRSRRTCVAFLSCKNIFD